MASRAQGSGSPPRVPPAEAFASALRRRRAAAALREQPRRERATAVLGATPAPPLLAAARGVPERPVLSAPATVHRVAMAVEVLRSGDRARLELGFEAGATLRLDAIRDGVALTLCVAPGLARLAAAELPTLVTALRSRGVRIASAEVRISTGRRPRGRSQR